MRFWTVHAACGHAAHALLPEAEVARVCTFADLPTRVATPLIKAGIWTRQAVAVIPDARLLRLRNFGAACLRDLRAVIPPTEPAP